MFFVDESGDPTLFARGGKVVVATESCSRFFIEGKLECPKVDALTNDLNALRAEVMADPYFKGVPSLDLQGQRTAIGFHAKDDPAEVRYLVFQLLRKHTLRFSAVVRDKLVLLDEVIHRRQIDPGYRYDPNGHQLYDEMTRRLFARPGTGDAHRIVFAQRGQKPRTKAFMEAIEQKEDPMRDGSSPPPRSRPSEVICGVPKDHAGLQAVDYFLWALQRFYERRETRHLDFIWPQTQEIVDLDAPRIAGHDEATEDFVPFNEKHPLTLESRTGVGKGSRDIG